MRPLLLGLSAAFALAGCANLNSINHSFRPDNGDALMVDAKQRAIYTVTKQYDDKSWKAVCAEPSPDALSALSASGALDATVMQKALGVTFGSQEGAASIGLRTQTITTLRDAMYRLCEGYASNALDEIGFARLQRRYQNIMLGLLSIEQLTGAVVANQAMINGSVSSRLGQSLAQVTEYVQKARDAASATKAALEGATATAKTADDELKKADANFKAAKTAANGDETVQAVKDAKAVLDAKKTAADDAGGAKAKVAAKDVSAKAELASLEDLRKDLDRASQSASTVGSFQTAGVRPQTMDSASITKVAETVKDIVTLIVDKDFTRETCLDTFLSRTSDKIVNFKVAARFCGLAIETQMLEAAARTTDTKARDALISSAALTGTRFTQFITNEAITEDSPPKPLGSRAGEGKANDDGKK